MRLYQHCMCIADIMKCGPSSVLMLNMSTSSFVVLVALYQKKVVTQHDLQKWEGSAWNMHLDLIFDLCTRPSEDVATTADVLDMVGWKKEAEMLRGYMGLC